jgi:hypothetical protein
VILKKRYSKIWAQFDIAPTDDAWKNIEARIKGIGGRCEYSFCCGVLL